MTPEELLGVGFGHHMPRRQAVYLADLACGLLRQRGFLSPKSCGGGCPPKQAGDDAVARSQIQADLANRTVWEELKPEDFTADGETAA